MTRPRILPHVAVIAALITAVLPLTTLLDSGWFGASIAIVIAIVAAGYAGRWSNALLALALQALPVSGGPIPAGSAISSGSTAGACRGSSNPQARRS
jgi:hypothetical protein